MNVNLCSCEWKNAPALIAAEDLIKTFRGYIRAAVKGRADCDSDDVAQTVRMTAVEFPEAFNVTGPKAARDLIAGCIDVAHRSRSTAPVGRPSTAERLASLAPSIRAVILAEVRALGTRDREKITRYINLRLNGGPVDPLRVLALCDAAAPLAPIETLVAEFRAEDIARAPRPLTPQVRARPTGRILARFAVPKAPSAPGYHADQVRARRLARAARRSAAR